MKLLRSVATALSVAIVAGCTGLGFGVDMGKLNADQLKALANDKSSAAACTQYVGTGGTFTAFYMNNDKTFGTGGGVTTVKCGAAEASFSDQGKAHTPASPAVAPVAPH